MPAKFDIVVYGATGFTGQLVAEYLAAHYAATATLKWAMAGRSLTSSQSVRDAIGAPADTPLIVADASDPASLKAMIDQTQLGRDHRRPLSALWQRTGRGLRGLGHRLYRSLRRADLDAADDRRASRQPRKASGARIVFSCGYRFAAVRTRRVLRVRKRRSACSARRLPRVKGRVRDMQRHVLRRHRGERAGRHSRRLRRISAWWRSSRIPSR